MASLTDTPTRAFPPGFTWGAATAAYQIEGATAEDGRGESIWDRFAAQSGTIVDGHNGGVACDSYHRYREDVRLLRELGLDAYRFSIAWPRVVPQGRGPVNTAGLDYYDRLVDELLANGIDPYVTLYHWDLPQALEDRGGWPQREVVDAFVEYADAVSARLADRVTSWITHNEPWVAAWLGYGKGEHAPGRRSQADALAAAHHLLLSHGLAADVLRANGAASVGISLDLIPIQPLTSSDADVVAAHREDGTRNRWFLDPVLQGAYPEDVVELWQDDLPAIADGDLAAVARPLDFLGVNYYRRHIVRAGRNGAPIVVEPPGAEQTSMGWEVYPDGLHELLVSLHGNYELPPVLITENGAAFDDVRRNGTVDDPERTSYVARHVEAIARAVEDGVPVGGYFLWSLLDNFEWALGFSKRFGIVYVDFETLERVPKGSYAWYRDFIAAQRATQASP